MEESVSLLSRLYGEQHSTTLVASAKWAQVLFFRGDLKGAEAVFRRLLPLLRDGYGRGGVKAESLAYALNGFAYLRRTQGDSREAEMLFRESLALSPRMSPDEWRFTNGTTRSTLASTLADQGRFEEALQTSREAVAECRQRGETDAPNFGFALKVFGGFLTERGNFAEADENLRGAEAIFRKYLSPSALWLGDNLRNQAVSLYRQGQYAEALGKTDEALSIYNRSFGPHYDHYPTALIIKGLSLIRAGRQKEGEKIVRDALKLRTDTLPKEHYWVALAEGALGECLTLRGRYAEAEPFLVESYNALRGGQGEENPRTTEARRRLRRLYEAWGKPDLAAQYPHQGRGEMRSPAMYGPRE